ncbi:signal peptidase I U [Abditibacteriota bacterium]|nr:signal peptidase I U [Abditibacteriota bacterium]
MPIQLQLGQNPQPIDPEVEKEKRRSARFWMVATSIICLLSFVMVLRLYAFEGTVVTSGSMEPTLYRGDYALFDHRAAIRSRWNRGDVIIFLAPPSWESGGAEGENEGSFEGQTLVKRIIGLPGERVSLLGGVVYINNKVLPQDYLKNTPLPDAASPFTLGPNQYYVMGDNRNNSDDSRANGPISEEDIKGRVLFKLWPLSRIGGLPATNYESLNTDN